MAKIKTSALVADIKGKVGGNVFAANKGGNYVRRNKKPTNRNSVLQQQTRMRFTLTSGTWRGLTTAQKNSWNEGAVNFPYQDSLGETKIYSGQQLFNKLNTNLYNAGSGFILTCPVPQSFPSMIIDSISNKTAGNIFIVTLSIDGAQEVPEGFLLVGSATTKLSSGITSPQSSLFKQLFAYPATEPTEDLEIAQSYNPIFGALTTGDTVFVGFKLVSAISGESSILVTQSSTRIAS